MSSYINSIIKNVKVRKRMIVIADTDTPRFLLRSSTPRSMGQPWLAQSTWWWWNKRMEPSSRPHSMSASARWVSSRRRRRLWVLQILVLTIRSMFHKWKYSMTWRSSGSYITNSKSCISVSSFFTHLTYMYPKSYKLIFIKKCWDKMANLTFIKKCWNMTQLGSLCLQILTSASVCCWVIGHKSELSFQSPNLQMTIIITTTIISANI